MTRRVAVVTGTRAEFGLLRNLLASMRDDPAISLDLIVTGSHLSDKFGLTVRDITQDGFDIASEVPILQDSDTPVSIAHSMSSALTGLTTTFQNLKPDLLLILGDRFEIFAAATAAHLCNIPIAHIHGGEITEGSLDEAFRHSITKMSQIHFVSTPKYRSRVIQLGEDPTSVYYVGSLGVENLKCAEMVNRRNLEEDLDLEFSERSVLVTYHPVTLNGTSDNQNFGELLEALAELDETTIIFTYPNADIGALSIIESIDEFITNYPRAYAFQSLGQLKYISCMNCVDVVIGNSSSGIIEAPSMKKPSINIGERQSGRVRADSVIDCSPKKSEISEALKTAFSNSFQDRVMKTVNPYELEGTSLKILNTIKQTALDNIIKKKFFDLSVQ
jgi:GDP/UDP-N,N'-diacetylbacillosamine 2-epimerase (hydrolysing)